MTASINWRGNGHTTPLLITAVVTGATYLLATHILKAQGDLKRFGLPGVMGLAAGYLSGLGRLRDDTVVPIRGQALRATVKIGNWTRIIEAIDAPFKEDEERNYLVVWGLPMIVSPEDFQAVLEQCDSELKLTGLQSLSLYHEGVIGDGKMPDGAYFTKIWETETVETSVQTRPMVLAQRGGANGQTREKVEEE